MFCSVMKWSNMTAPVLYQWHKRKSRILSQRELKEFLMLKSTRLYSLIDKKKRDRYCNNDAYNYRSDSSTARNMPKEMWSKCENIDFFLDFFIFLDHFLYVDSVSATIFSLVPPIWLLWSNNEIWKFLWFKKTDIIVKERRKRKWREGGKEKEKQGKRIHECPLFRNKEMNRGKKSF